MFRFQGLRTVVRCSVPRARHFSRLNTTILPVFTRTFSVSRFQRNEMPKDLTAAAKAAAVKTDKPAMMIAFTCKKCNTRSSHTMSKQAYTGGTVLIQCPGCKSRHLIADHLKIFSDDHITIQDILSTKGESVALTTDDLAFEDIPEKLRSTIGHHAKDAPKDMQEKSGAESKHILPGSNDANQK
ncbi:LAFA_0G19702g1_1 [Lachancea sp. 'fantastica']|nr:LAFA_0G19702g1_1 [Lachancea sp. 'fantastica']